MNNNPRLLAMARLFFDRRVPDPTIMPTITSQLPVGVGTILRYKGGKGGIGAEKWEGIVIASIQDEVGQKVHVLWYVEGNGHNYKDSYEPQIYRVCDGYLSSLMGGGTRVVYRKGTLRDAQEIIDGIEHLNPDNDVWPGSWES